MTTKNHPPLTNQVVSRSLEKCDGPSSERGDRAPGLAFTSVTENDVVADFFFDSSWRGYHGLVCAGAVGLALDEAIEGCVNRQGREALVIDLHTRIHRPVVARISARVSARLTGVARGTYSAEAQLEQGGQVVATAEAKLVDTDAIAVNSTEWPFFSFDR